MYSISAVAKSGSSGRGWMQLTGQTVTQVASLQQFCVTTKVMEFSSSIGATANETSGAVRVVCAVPNPEIDRVDAGCEMREWHSPSFPAVCAHGNMQRDRRDGERSAR
jgi:hypothetical protein